MRNTYTFCVVGMLIIFAVSITVWFVWGSVLLGGVQNDTPASQRQAYMLMNNQCVQLDVASTPEDRRRGLSGYQNLADNKGMLFLYEEFGMYGFWMKDMNFAIDIIWLDGMDRVVGIKENAQPDSYPQSFQPDAPAKKVVETTAGWAETNNIKTGDHMTLIAPTTTKPTGCATS